MVKLEGKIAAVTGGGRGLGKEIARSLSERGAKVFILARSAQELEDSSKEFSATPVRCDITLDSDVSEAFGKIGEIDILVNNAGIWAKTGIFEESDDSDTRRMFEVNFFALARAMKAVLPEMRRKGVGTIVNVLSTSALEGKPNQAPYVASKFASRGLSEAVRKELAGTGVRIISAYPGGMKTGIFSREDKNPSSYKDFMEPREVAEKIVENLERENPDEELVLKRPGK